MRKGYRIALLGAEWIGRYEVAADRDHITSRLACPWAEATQSIARVSSPLATGRPTGARA